MSGRYVKRGRRCIDDPKGVSMASKRMLVVAYATQTWRLKRTVKGG